jgi:hypothetical protein
MKIVKLLQLEKLARNDQKLSKEKITLIILNRKDN